MFRSINNYLRVDEDSIHPRPRVNDGLWPHWFFFRFLFMETDTPFGHSIDLLQIVTFVRKIKRANRSKVLTNSGRIHPVLY
jgi:hypothetical protein